MRKSQDMIAADLRKQLGPILKELGTATQLVTADEAQRILSISARPLLAKMKSNLSAIIKESKNLIDGFAVYRGRKGAAQYKVYVGPDYRKGGGGNLAHIFEYGTAPRTRRSYSKDGKVKKVSTGQIKATPFMRPAWEETKDGVFKDAEFRFLKLIDKKIKNIQKQ
jgi:hypothetical protein